MVPPDAAMAIPPRTLTVIIVSSTCVKRCRASGRSVREMLAARLVNIFCKLKSNHYSMKMPFAEYYCFVMK